MAARKSQFADFVSSLLQLLIVDPHSTVISYSTHFGVASFCYKNVKEGIPSESYAGSCSLNVAK